MKTWFVLLFGLAFVALCGCRNEGTKPAAAADPADPPATIVKMTDHDAFDPATVTVNVGDSVEWQNTSQIAHSVVCDPAKAGSAKDVALPEGAKPFDSGVIQPGKSFTQKFGVAGTYKYVCVPHEGMGMKGEVVVKAAEK